MTPKISKLLKNPKKYIPLIFKVFQQSLCFLFRNSAFHLQGHMDINPKSRWYKPEFAKHTGGFFPANDGEKRKIMNLEPWDTTRKDMLILFIRTILENEIEGDFVEVGVYKGHTAKLIHYYAPERRLHLFDTFEGLTFHDIKNEQERIQLSIPEEDFHDTSFEKVKGYISPQNKNVFFYMGYFPDSIPSSFNQCNFAFVHLDADLYEPTRRGIEYFYPRLNVGAFLVVHDYNAWPGARKAVDEFFKDKPELPIPMPDKSGSALIVKQ